MESEVKKMLKREFKLAAEDVGLLKLETRLASARASAQAFHRLGTALISAEASRRSKSGRVSTQSSYCTESDLSQDSWFHVRNWMTYMYQKTTSRSKLTSWFLLIPANHMRL